MNINLVIKIYHTTALYMKYLSNVYNDCWWRNLLRDYWNFL